MDNTLSVSTSKKAGNRQKRNAAIYTLQDKEEGSKSARYLYDGCECRKNLSLSRVLNDVIVKRKNVRS
ncbi:hypothetical protein TNCV_448671 [Trichonephila clavipes]|nr:hypothetical protein TNCV_448671 [Trichonephila clavipes]